MIGPAHSDGLLRHRARPTLPHRSIPGCDDSRYPGGTGRLASSLPTAGKSPPTNGRLPVQFQDDYLTHYNVNPKPFVWSTTVNAILDKSQEVVILGTDH